MNELWKWTKDGKYQYLPRRANPELFDVICVEIKEKGKAMTFPGDDRYLKGRHKFFESDDGWVYWRFKVLIDRQPKLMFKAAMSGKAL